MAADRKWEVIRADPLASRRRRIGTFRINIAPH